MGAYLSTFASCIPTILYATLLAGQYTTPAIHCEVTAVFTNTAPVDAYRGAGRPEATYVVERLVRDGRARDEASPRTRSAGAISSASFPYQTPVALTYDIGDYDSTLGRRDEARRRRGLPGAARPRPPSAASCAAWATRRYIEACGLAPSNVAGALGARAGLFEAGEVRVHPTGSVTVFTGSHSHGQGHETTFAQVVADRLGIPIDDVDVVHGDTGRVAVRHGHLRLALARRRRHGDRQGARQGRRQGQARSPRTCSRRPTPTSSSRTASSRWRAPTAARPFGEVALTAYVPHNYPLDKLEPGLDETAFYDPTNFTYPAGTHICEVEIDPDTGVVQIVSFTACDDFGNVINPMIVEGQVHGGLAQGIGQALLEELRLRPRERASS